MGLKGITIETPPQAEAHINAADDRAIWEAVIGMDGVVNVGQKLKATLISNNLLRIYDGALVVGGAVGRIPFGEYEDITINNGTQNQLRNDLVVAQIEANGAIENMKLHYIQGVPGDVAKDPDYTAGNVYEGETLRQYPLYRVKLNGLNVEAVEPLFEVLPNLGKVKDEVGELNRKLVFLDQNAQNSSVNGWTLIRNGNIVTFKHNKVLSGVIAGHSYSNQGKIPEGYRPAIDITLPGDRIIGATITGSFYVSIGPAGNTNFVSDGNHNENQSYVASGAYITSDLFPLNDIPKVEI
ncbi:hypothetical protein CLOSCI_02412 [[Clostridium] scindens ATCC 35704]|uniref:Uncharacterized protein n=1 Tax=Clostridium scindens (strain ATCC 35704 / DSM 5676 / VPI 13733 / 19) TaxID=411468 RepID=B0NG09_CLOS5|nr:hypothetical protein [[Clostridium] scindens]EDS06463.1 hypothetical protein CLOSCI_02412 [[Clostridium] scindens ATCC 35704]QBF76235.1 hypothetical protein HDCHBGLK_03652 [[Clostridium] scindens ATCC 35704]QRO36000.1 hypothetical protein I6J57_12045 [[Clostridium] scindens]WPB35389.1 hypothetical protein PBLEJBOC_00029 [[Clostridium] scindens]BDF17174.1 hypothetical protein CE91St59_24370 [[Clostridium] scindens]